MSPTDKKPSRPLPTMKGQSPPSREEFGSDDDQKTPVTNDPLLRLDHRARATQRNTESTLDSINRLHIKVDTYIETDQREHQRLSENMTSLDRDLVMLQTRHDQQAERMDKWGDKLTMVAEGQATVTGQLEILIDAFKGRMRVEEHREKVTIETAAVVERTTLDDKTDEAKTRRARGLKILQIFGSVVGSGGLVAVIIAALMDKC